MTAVSDETGRDWLPLKYEDGPDFCTVTFATGAAFALTVHPERMKLMEAALSASPVAQESQLLTLLDAATVALQGLIERPGDDDSWGEANKLLPKLLSRLERRGDECCAHGVELHQDCYRCDEGPVAQEPVARLCGYCKTWNSKPCGEQCYLQPNDPVWTSPPAYPVAQEPVASDDPYFIMLWNWFEKRRGKEDMRAIQNDGGLSVDDLETMLDEHEADLLSQINTPPAPSAGVGADEIAQIIATKCFDPRVIDSSGKPFWKKSQWREAQQAANAILLLLSGGGSEVTHLRMPTQQQNI